MVSDQLPESFVLNPYVAAFVEKITIPVTPLLDKLIWLHSSEGVLTAKTTFAFLHPNSIVLDWGSIIWCPCIPPSISFSV